jgi:hypothetical protein
MRKKLLDIDEHILFADGFDDALIGYVEKANSEVIALYDKQKCIEILIEHGLSSSEAVDYFNFNILGSYLGDYTPAFGSIFKK